MRVLESRLSINSQYMMMTLGFMALQTALAVSYASTFRPRAQPHPTPPCKLSLSARRALGPCAQSERNEVHRLRGRAPLRARQLQVGCTGCERRGVQWMSALLRI